MSGQSIDAAAAAAQASGTGVRRHHTISASSRSARDAARAIPEDQQIPVDDEVVDENWDGPVGAVGEKSGGLHRQASLPTRYARAFQGSARTPRHMTSMNSLSAIAGQEHEEEDWEKEMRGLRQEEELELAQSDHGHSMGHGSNGSDNASPLTPNFASGHTSPPLADSGVRRHQSLTAGHGSAHRRVSAGLRRSGTLHTPGHMRAPPAARSPSPTNAEEGEEEDESAYAEDSYFSRTQQAQQQAPQQGAGNGYAPSPLSRSPWGTPGEWRAPGNSGLADEGSLDEVQHALSNLELSSNQSHSSYGGSASNSQHGHGGNAFQGGQSVHPPRFNPQHPPPPQAPGMRGVQPGGGRKVTQLDTHVESRAGGPMSASAYVQGAVPGQQQQGRRGPSEDGHSGRDRAFSAAGSTSWDQKERVLTGRSSNPNLQYAANAYGQGQAVPSVPPIPQQYLQQQQQGGAPRLGVTTSFGQGVQGQVGGPMNQGQNQGGVTSPVDVPTLIATKGYNPVNFDIKPGFARYFVIKSYTEEDVHKSIKYEIWSSTDPGNKRLDKAFKETAGRGPIYLFFSVNASGHFCGMAEMLTPVDYTRSSTVWASDKWKGVFKVRWIFIRDIPNATLRHIKLNNTQERKPVTNSRDTQELLPDAGHEMLRIFHVHPARTSLLQDFSYYELQSAQKTQLQTPVSPPQPASRIQSPQPQQMAPNPQQHPFAMANPAALAYASQQQHMQVPQMGMSPMMGNMQVPMGMNQQFAMHSVLRHPSPGPTPVNGQQFLGMGGQF